MGSSSDWETLRPAAETLETPRRAATKCASSPRIARPTCCSNTPSTAHAARARSDHRGRGWRGTSARHDGREDFAARARRTGAIEGAQRPRLPAVDRADAGRQCRATFAIGVAGATNAALARRRHSRQQASRHRHSARGIPPARRPQACLQPRPDAARLPQHEGRHHRRGPARAHAGAGGLSAGALRFMFLDRSADAPGAQVAPHPGRRTDDSSLLARACTRSRRHHLRLARTSRSTPWPPSSAQTTVLPPAAALGASQDRLDEKSLFRQLTIPTPAFAAVDSWPIS